MLLKRKKNNIIILFLLWGLISCENETPREKDIAAKVDNKVLTLENVSSLLKEMNLDEEYAEIYKRRWIDREVLYLEALSDSLQYTPMYKKLIKNAEKEILQGIYLERFFNENKIEPAVWELQQFYKSNKEEFTLSGEMYVFNLAKFVDYETAEKFRKEVIKYGWFAARNITRDDSNLVKLENNISKPKEEILDSKLDFILRKLNEKEVGPVFKKNDIFKVIYLKRKYKKDEIPLFEDIMPEIKSRYIVQQKEKLYRNLLNDLYKKYKVENY